MFATRVLCQGIDKDVFDLGFSQGAIESLDSCFHVGRLIGVDANPEKMGPSWRTPPDRREAAMAR
jgi:hypothetical protein